MPSNQLSQLILVSFWYWIKRARVHEDEIDKESNQVRPTGESYVLSFGMCWRLASGSVDIKKKHYYTTDEVFEKIEKKHFRADKK